MNVPDQQVIYFDCELIKTIKEQSPFWSLSWVYRSNWRVLHVDGFEKHLPFRMAPPYMKRQFFQYDLEVPNDKVTNPA